MSAANPPSSPTSPLNRRDFLVVAGSAAAVGLLFPTARAQASTPAPQTIKAVAFDAFPILDPRPVFARAEELFPGRGAELSNLWRTRQFEYTWLRTLARSYADFSQVTEEALVFSTTMLKLELTPERRRTLMQAYLELKAYPDVQPALEALRTAGVRIAFLSNATVPMLNAGLKNSGLENLFEHVISTDAIKTYKPDPAAYQLGIDALQLKKEEILFAAFAGWDAAGAKSFGYPTFWVNRLNLPAEELGVLPDATGSGLSDLVAFVKALG